MKVLVNADQVIDVLARDGALTPAELAERVGIPRSSAYRLLSGLHAVGLTEPVADGGAQLSLRWLRLADRARTALTEWTAAHPALTQLVELSGQTAYLSVLRDDEAMCIDWVQGRGIGVLLLRPGRGLPLHAGAAGRTLLAWRADIDRYLALGGRRRYTARTLIDADELLADVDKTRRRGYAVSDEDVTEGIGALGMPVRSGDGEVVGAVSLAGLAGQMTANRQEYREVLGRAADAIGAAYRRTGP